MTDVEKLQRKLRIHKERANALKTTTEKLISENSDDKTEVDHCVEQLELYYNTISKLSDEIIDALISTTDEAFSAGESKQALEFLEEISRSKRKLLNFQQKFLLETASAISSAGPVEHHRGTSRLPKLELPKYRGDPQKWSSFWDAFESSIHSNTSLTEVEKFNYLNSLLQGPAADATAPISVTNDNYQTAVDLIKERFGKREIIISSHVDALLKIPNATSSVASLRKVYDLCQIHIGGLRALGIGSDMYGVIVAPIILSKLPEEVKLVLTRKNRTAVWNLDELRVLLQEEVENREWVSDSNKVTSVKPDKVHHTEAKLSTNLVSGFSNNRVCVFCNDPNHPAWKCLKVTKVEDRLQKAKYLRLCFNCLRPGHAVPQCNSNSTCRQCQKKHHTALCYGNSKERSAYGSAVATESRVGSPGISAPKNKKPSSVVQATTPSTTASAVVKPSSLILQTATMYITSPETGKYCKVRVIFDQGSQRSFISEKISTELNLRFSEPENISIGSFRSESKRSETFNTTKVVIQFTDGSSQELHAIVVPEVIVSLYRTQVEPEVLSSFGNIQFADGYSEPSEMIDVDVLIGVDHYWEFVSGEVIRGPDGLIAMKSSLGWLLSGRHIPKQSSPSQCGVFFVGAQVGSVCSQDQCLDRLWKLDAIGIRDKDSPSGDLEEEVLNNFNEGIQYKDCRYKVRFPWNGQEDKLPSNYDTCTKRLRGLIQRLQKSNQMEAYSRVIYDQLERGFIEKVSSPEEIKGVVHYIPHHPVVKEDHATTKLRIVYDCSAKSFKDGLSLNDCLHKGVSLVDNLAAILLRFRCHNVALIADIEKAFLQVEIKEEDRDATRFLWLSKTAPLSSQNNLSVYRFRRVLFGASSSPFLLAATIKYHLEHSSSEVAKKMQDSFYVDNLLTGARSEDSALSFYHEAKKVMQEAGMNLREWHSNSEKVTQNIPESDAMKGISAGILGLNWKTDSDTIHVKNVHQSKYSESSITKRDALRAVALVFDPLGFISPVTISGKILMQDLWIQNKGWNDPLQKPEEQRLRNFVKNFQYLEDLKFPRRFAAKVESSQLHIFVDASMKAYAAVAYLVGENEEGRSVSSIVMSKTRVAPLKELSLPKLELMAAYLGTEMGAFIQKSIEVSQVTVWSDSQITLAWIKSKKPLQPFVRNRVRKMKEKSYCYRYCPTSDNIADLPSRGCDVQSLALRKDWFHGPSWLTDPSRCPCSSSLMEDSLESCESVVSNPVLLNSNCEALSPPLGIDSMKHSSYLKLMSVTSYAMRFVKGLRGNPRPKHLALEASEISQARLMWERHIQSKYFKENSKEAISQLKKQLRMFEDDDCLFRCRGRIDRAEVPYDAKFPKFIPKEGHFTKLLIIHVHNKIFHQGVRHVVFSLRQEFWIPQIRQVVKRCLKSCVTCNLWDAKPYSLPDPPPLPSLRVTEKPPFSFVGCDFAGPLYHRMSRKEVEKCYICIFTCAVTRAVHLELVHTLSAEDFLLCFRRFVSRRGKPIEVVSDNAKTFVTCSTAVDKLWNDVVQDDCVLSYVAKEGVKWKFNVPRAPWWGGFFERLVRSVKISMKKSIGRYASLDFVKIETLLIEIEAILNSRPLTFIYSEVDSGKALSPKDFLISSSYAGIPSYSEDEADPNYTEIDTASDALLKKLQAQHRTLERFWTIWRKEYLTSLQEFHRYNTKKGNSSAAVGDVILLKEDIPRGQWKRGIIVKILPSCDGLIRAATVQISGKLYTRPINLLVPLEVKTSSDILEVEAVSEDVIRPEVQLPVSRPRREAAVRALSRISEWTRSDSEEFQDHNDN